MTNNISCTIQFVEYVQFLICYFTLVNIFSSHLETLQQPNLQRQQSLTTKTKSRVDKSLDEDSTILEEEMRKSEDDVMKNKKSFTSG